MIDAEKLLLAIADDVRTWGGEWWIGTASSAKDFQAFMAEHGRPDWPYDNDESEES